MEDIRATFQSVVPNTFDSDVIDYIIDVISEEAESSKGRPNHVFITAMVDSVGPFLLQVTTPTTGSQAFENLFPPVPRMYHAI